MCKNVLFPIFPASHPVLECSACGHKSAVQSIAPTDWAVQAVGWEGVSGLPPVKYLMVCPKCIDNNVSQKLDWDDMSNADNYHFDMQGNWFLNIEYHTTSYMHVC